MLSHRTTMNPTPTILLPPRPPPPLLPSLLPLPRLPSPSLSLSAAAPDRAAATAEVELFLDRHGVYTPRPQKVVVLWDLDNKPPRGPPFAAALALRRVAELFGRVVDISAYANRHAFLHLPHWVLSQRRADRRSDLLERKGLSLPSEPYLCSVCGRKCRTNLDLKKHFRQLHERERDKKLARMRSLKGKKRQKYKERFISGNSKYEEAARQLLTPKTGYGLAAELRRAGVFVKTVEDKPQAADSALKRQMQHSMARGIDWLFLVSDDSDFTEMVRRAREADLRTVVVGDGRKALGRHADIWVSWMRVENGEVGEEVLMEGRNGRLDGEEEGLFDCAGFYEGGDLSDEIVVRSSAGFGGGGGRVSAFSEEEEVVNGNFGSENSQLFGFSSPEQELLWDSEEEEDGYI